MICPACGSQNAPAATFCSSCGTALTSAGPMPGPGGYMPGPGGYYQAPPMPPRTSGMAIAGFVLSFFCSILGLIFSIIAHNEIKRSNGNLTGEGLAVAGIIISIISLLIGIVVAASGG